MILRRLLYPMHAIDFRQHLAQQPAGVEQFERTADVAFSEHLSKLVPNALPADLPNQRGEALNCGKGSWLDHILKARCETHRAQHPQLVFLKAAFRIANGADHPGLQVVTAADKIQHAIAVERVHQQAVDGEVTALHVLPGILGIPHLVRMAPIRVSAVVAEGRHFNIVRVLGRSCRNRNIFWRGHQHNPELRPDGVRFGKNAHHLRGSGVGRDIVIRGNQAEQHVANTASGKVGLEAAQAQFANDGGGMGAHTRLMIAICGWRLAVGELAFGIWPKRLMRGFAKC